MLGLMCNLYRIDGYIPRNRPEIYEKCSVMLFERWDKSRGIVVPLPHSRSTSGRPCSVSLWIARMINLSGGVSDDEINGRNVSVPQ